jgi:hypothetical protein
MTAQPTARPTLTGVRGRALLVALGLALAAAVLPATAAHASPQSPDTGSQLTNPGGNPQPPEPPDPPQVGPEDLANPTENPEPPLPPDPPDVPDWGPDDLANPTENPSRRSRRTRPTTAPTTSPTRPRTPTRRCPRTPTPSPPATPSRRRSVWTPASAAPPPVRIRSLVWP